MLKKWFRADAGPSNEKPLAGEVSDVPSDYADSREAGSHDDNTAFDWRTLDSSSSGIFDSPDTHRIRVLQSEPARPANDDDNPGYDPYDTGSFDVENKG